jgi:hypothetical protein
MFRDKATERQSNKATKKRKSADLKLRTYIDNSILFLPSEFLQTLSPRHSADMDMARHAPTLMLFDFVSLSLCFFVTLFLCLFVSLFSANLSVFPVLF